MSFYSSIQQEHWKWENRRKYGFWYVIQPVPHSGGPGKAEGPFPLFPSGITPPPGEIWGGCLWFLGHMIPQGQDRNSMRELKMFQITVNISLMLLPKGGSEVGKLPVFTLLSAKGCIYMCEPVGGPTLPPTDGATCTVSWIPTTPKGFFQFRGLNLCTAVPLGVDQWRWNVPFQRFVQREKHILSPTLVLLASFLLSFRTKSFTFSFSHLVLHSSKTFILASWLELKC